MSKKKREKEKRRREEEERNASASDDSSKMKKKRRVEMAADEGVGAVFAEAGSDEAAAGEGAGADSSFISESCQRGFAAFATMSTVKGFQEADALTSWKALSAEQREACAQWERFVKDVKLEVPKKADDVEQSTTSGAARKRARVVSRGEESSKKEASKKVDDVEQSSTSGAARKRARARSEELSKKELSKKDEQVEQSSTSGASRKRSRAKRRAEQVSSKESPADSRLGADHERDHGATRGECAQSEDVQPRDAPPTSPVVNDAQEEDGDSIDDYGVFITGPHLFKTDSTKNFECEADLFKAFLAESLAVRLNYWIRARKINLPELNRRKHFVAEKGKRLREISAVTLLEMADRAQTVWDSSVAAMLKELAETIDDDEKEAIYHKYKLKQVMGDLVGSLWHLIVMEQLSQTSTGLRNALLAAAFSKRHELQHPWGISLLEGKYPKFKALRKSGRQTLWPRLSRSPFLPARSQPNVDVSSSPSIAEMSVVSSERRVRFKTAAKDRPLVTLDEDSKEGGDEDASAAATVRFKTSVKDQPLVTLDEDSKEGGDEDASAAATGEVEVSLNVKPLPSAEEVASRARSSLLNRMAGNKRRSSAGVSAGQRTKTNTFLADSAERHRQQRAERRQRELGGGNNPFGIFESPERLANVLFQRLAASQLHVGNREDVEIELIQAPMQETDKCFDVRSLVGSHPLTSNLRLFVESANPTTGCEFSLRALQFHLPNGKDTMTALRTSCKDVVEKLDWQVQPQTLNCPNSTSTCDQLATVRNLRLGCWLKESFCVHGKSKRGDSLTKQLMHYRAENNLSELEAANFVDELLKLDEALTKVIEAAFPSIAAEMHQTRGTCRLRGGRSVFSMVALVGSRGRHNMCSKTSVGIRAFVNLPLDKKGKKKIICQNFQHVQSENDEPLSINLKHGSVCFLSAKSAFSYSRDDSFEAGNPPNCITLEFSCMKGLYFDQHGTHEVEMAKCAVMLQHLKYVKNKTTDGSDKAVEVANKSQANEPTSADVEQTDKSRESTEVEVVDQSGEITTVEDARKAMWADFGKKEGHLSAVNGVMQFMLSSIEDAE